MSSHRGVVVRGRWDTLMHAYQSSVEAQSASDSAFGNVATRWRGFSWVVTNLFAEASPWWLPVRSIAAICVWDTNYYTLYCFLTFPLCRIFSTWVQITAVGPDVRGGGRTLVSMALTIFPFSWHRVHRSSWCPNQNIFTVKPHFPAAGGYTIITHSQPACGENMVAHCHLAHV